MTALVLVRHGETVWHAENRYAGRSDVALTARGRAQAEPLARWAADARPALVVSSPLARARDTAAPAARAAGVALRTDPRLVEVDFGAGEGRHRAEMRAAFPQALEAFLAAPSSHPLPGGEPGADAVARALPPLCGYADEAGPDATVLVVAHQTLLRLVLCALLEIPLDRYRAVFPRLDNGALTTVRLADGPPALLGLNVSLGG